MAKQHHSSKNVRMGKLYTNVVSSIGETETLDTTNTGRFVGINSDMREDARHQNQTPCNHKQRMCAGARGDS